MCRNHTGGGVERTKQQAKSHGTALQPGQHITHDVDACRTAEGQHQLEVRWHYYYYFPSSAIWHTMRLQLCKAGDSCHSLSGGLQHESK